MRQIVDFSDTTPHQRAILATYLMRNLHVEGKDIVDIGGVDVIGVTASPAEVEVEPGPGRRPGRTRRADVHRSVGGRADGHDGSVQRGRRRGQRHPHPRRHPRPGRRDPRVRPPGVGCDCAGKTVGTLASENTPEQIAAAARFTEAVEEAIVTVMQEHRSIEEFFLMNHGSMGAIRGVPAHLAHTAAREHSS